MGDYNAQFMPPVSWKKDNCEGDWERGRPRRGANAKPFNMSRAHPPFSFTNVSFSLADPSGLQERRVSTQLAGKERKHRAEPPAAASGHASAGAGQQSLLPGLCCSSSFPPTPPLKLPKAVAELPDRGRRRRSRRLGSSRGQREEQDELGRRRMRVSHLSNAFVAAAASSSDCRDAAPAAAASPSLPRRRLVVLSRPARGVPAAPASSEQTA